MAIVLVILAGASLGSAQSNEPITLHPDYILVTGVEDRELTKGYIYAFDGGWILADDDGLVYTCGCNGCEVEEVVLNGTPEPNDTPVPTDPPTTPPPTDPPPTDPPPTEEPVAKCNRGTGNGAEGCDPGNSGGKPGSAGEDNE